jgi:hypothetical protein
MDKTRTQWILSVSNLLVVPDSFNEFYLSSSLLRCFILHAFPSFLIHLCKRSITDIRYFSQNPSFIGAVLNLKPELARVYLPPDAVCLPFSPEPPSTPSPTSSPVFNPFPFFRRPFTNYLRTPSSPQSPTASAPATT